MEAELLGAFRTGGTERGKMKNVKGGCSASVTCPNGWELSCSHYSGNCYSENDGTIEGYINCGVGAIQQGCWQRDMSWLESY